MSLIRTAANSVVVRRMLVQGKEGPLPPVITEYEIAERLQLLTEHVIYLEAVLKQLLFRLEGSSGSRKVGGSNWD